MTSSYHPTVAKILTLLTEAGVWHETFEHEPVRTSEEAADLRDGYTLHQGAKAILIRVKQAGGHKFFAMLVLPGDERFDAAKVKAIFHAKDIRFATVPEVLELTEGIEPGGVPPFGNLFGLEVVTEPLLFQNEKIIFNAGDKRFSVAMKSTDYLKLVAPKLAKII